MLKNKKTILGMVLALAAVSAVFVTEQIFKPAYAVKSLVKLVAFLGSILIYQARTHQKLPDVVRLHKIKNCRPLLLCMAIFFAATLAAFFVFRNFLDLQSIRQSLISKENLTKDNCLYVFLYIIVCNSFLEESFFRGFVSGLFPDKRTGSAVSAVLFSLYHIGIFVTWFSLGIFLLCLASLVAAGLFLQWLVEKYGSILASYITHGSANIAINIIGALLIFEMI